MGIIIYHLLAFCIRNWLYSQGFYTVTKNVLHNYLFLMEMTVIHFIKCYFNGNYNNSQVVFIRDVSYFLQY